MFTEDEKMVYGQYWNGVKSTDGRPTGVYADPLAVHRALYQALPDFAELLAKLFPENEQPPEVTMDASGRVAPALAKAFGLTLFDPVTGEGCTERYCVRLLADYLDWCERQKKTPSTCADSSPPTICGQPATP